MVERYPSKFQSEGRLNTTLDVIRKIRDNNLSSARKYANEIIKNVITPCYEGRLPQGVTPVNGVDNIRVLSGKGAPNCFYTSFIRGKMGQRYEEPIAWILSYYAQGSAGEKINFDRYLHRFNSALDAFAEETGQRFNDDEKAVMLQNSSIMVGLESLAYRSNDGKFLVLIESEERGILGTKEKAFEIVYPGAAAIAVLPLTEKDKRDGKPPVELQMPAQIHMPVDIARKFVEGKLSGDRVNYMLSEENLAIGASKRNVGADEDDPEVTIKFAPSFEKFCFSTRSPVRAETYNKN